MPVVSTYRPEDYFGSIISTLLPIYPDEIGQNVKGVPSIKPTYEEVSTKILQKTTQAAVQSTIGQETTQRVDIWTTEESLETTTSVKGKTYPFTKQESFESVDYCNIRSHLQLNKGFNFSCFDY